MNLNNAALLKCGVLNLKFRPADAEDLQPNEFMNKRAVVAPPVIVSAPHPVPYSKTQLNLSDGVPTQKTGKLKPSRPRASIRAERAVQSKKMNKTTISHNQNASDTSLPTYTPFHLEKRRRLSEDYPFIPAAAFLAALNSPISTPPPPPPPATVELQSLSMSNCNDDDDDYDELYAPSRPPEANEEDVSFVGPIIRALAQVTTTQADSSLSLYHTEEEASFHYKDGPVDDVLSPVDPDFPELLLYPPSPPSSSVVDQGNLPLKSEPPPSPPRSSTSDPLIKEERSSPSPEARSTLLPDPPSPSIKKEPPEAVTLVSRTRIMSGTHRVFPLPQDCAKACRHFNRNRARWGKIEVDSFKTEFRSKSRRWSQKHPNAPEVALAIDRWMIREDGLIIDWTSSQPVWSDTLRPATPEQKTEVIEIVDVDEVGPTSETPAEPISSPADLSPRSRAFLHGQDAPYTLPGTIPPSAAARRGHPNPPLAFVKPKQITHKTAVNSATVSIPVQANVANRPCQRKRKRPPQTSHIPTPRPLSPSRNRPSQPPMVIATSHHTLT